MTETPRTEDAADPPPPDAPVEAAQPAPELARIANLERKAALLLIGFVALLVAAALYLLYARGAFEPTQRLVLLADDSEGVLVGMDLTYAGFPIGRVARTELGDSGQVRILVDVPLKDAHWLKTSSVFTLERGIVGGARLRAFTGIMDDAVLPAGSERVVLRGDLSAEMPKLVADARDVLANVKRITDPDGTLDGVLSDLQSLTARFAGPKGALHGLMGNEADAQKVVQAIDQLNALLAQLKSLSARADTLALKADKQVFGPGGVVPGAQDSVRQLNAALRDARTSLARVDDVLKDAKTISGNAADASADLGALRGDVEASLRKIDALITELNRKWPFAPKQQEVTLP